MRMLLGLMAFVIWTGAYSATALAQDRSLVVVELFTSQGCSSCPPADKLLTRLAKRDDVLALALHVDYWDYIGWADSFARAEHTDRQKAYSNAAGLRSVYTPQMIISGVKYVIGFKPMEVADYIEMYRSKPARISLTLKEAPGVLHLEARPASQAPLPERIIVLLVRFTEMKTVEITRGENRGNTLTYSNIVTDMSEIGLWDGQGVLEIEAPLEGDGPAAIILQEAGPGEILAAVRLR